MLNSMWFLRVTFHPLSLSNDEPFFLYGFNLGIQNTTEHFNFAIFTSPVVSFYFCSSFSSALSVRYYLISISIHQNSWSITTHSRRSITTDSKAVCRNVQSLFSVRLFLYHFIYLKLLWLVFIGALVCFCYYLPVTQVSFFFFFAFLFCAMAKRKHLSVDSIVDVPLYGRYVAYNEKSLRFDGAHFFHFFPHLHFCS